MAAVGISFCSRKILARVEMDEGKRNSSGRLRNFARKNKSPSFFGPLQEAVDDALEIYSRANGEYVADTEEINDAQAPSDVNAGDNFQMPILLGDFDCSQDPSWMHKEEFVDQTQLLLLPPPGSGETQPPQVDLSSDSEDKMTQEPMRAPEQKNGPGRQLVHKEHIAYMVKAYVKAYATFIKLRKGLKPIQTVPSKVWQEVYKAYKEAYPESKFKEESLKDHLRLFVKDMQASKTPSDIPQDSQDPGQDEELLEKLMATDSWKARNILQTRMDAMHGLVRGMGNSNEREKAARMGSGYGSGNGSTARKGTHEDIAAGKEDGKEAMDGDETPPSSSHSGQTSYVTPRHVTKSGGTENIRVFRPPTKSQNLKEAREDMGAMLGQFKSMAEDRRAESTRKRALSDSKETLQEAKRHESAERKNALAEQRVAIASQAKMSQINLLKEQRTLGLISDLDFKSRCKEIFDT